MKTFYFKIRRGYLKKLWLIRNKSKMKIITSRAMKANRTYKHVVQNVEKFISKSEPKYKLAGLYVMDSIIRRSRNDFGPERDVYAPRFQKVEKFKSKYCPDVVFFSRIWFKHSNTSPNRKCNSPTKKSQKKLLGFGNREKFTPKNF